MDNILIEGTWLCHVHYRWRSCLSHGHYRWTTWVKSLWMENMSQVILTERTWDPGVAAPGHSASPGFHVLSQRERIYMVDDSHIYAAAQKETRQNINQWREKKKSDHFYSELDTVLRCVRELQKIVCFSSSVLCNLETCSSGFCFLIREFGSSLALFLYSSFSPLSFTVTR